MAWGRIESTFEDNYSVYWIEVCCCFWLDVTCFKSLEDSTLWHVRHFLLKIRWNKHLLASHRVNYTFVETHSMYWKNRHLAVSDLMLRVSNRWELPTYDRYNIFDRWLGRIKNHLLQIVIHSTIEETHSQRNKKEGFCCFWLTIHVVLSIMLRTKNETTVWGIFRIFPFFLSMFKHEPRNYAKCYTRHKVEAPKDLKLVTSNQKQQDGSLHRQRLWISSRVGGIRLEANSCLFYVFFDRNCCTGHKVKDTKDLKLVTLRQKQQDKRSPKAKCQ